MIPHERQTHPRRRGAAKATAAGAALAVALLAVTACGASSAKTDASSTSSSTSAPATGAVVETNPPGDIPDNQAFVPYTGAGFTVTIPEGWARSSSGKATVFSDKYNSITVLSSPAAVAPTASSVRAVDLRQIKASSKGFVPGAISTVRRTAGTAVLATYRALSDVNPVTGKVANEAVERYTFWRGGTTATLTLAAPVGSDNVDPWRKVTDSFRWTK